MTEIKNAAYASGFRIPEVSIAGLGASNALMADTHTTGALPHNPAAMAFRNKRVFIVGLINARPTFDADTELGTATESKATSCVVLPSGYFMDYINATTK